MQTVAILGLGEAGSCYAADLLGAGVRVRGYDPVARPELAGLEILGGAADAVRGAQVVLSLNSAKDSERAARDAAPALGSGTVYADLNTSSAACKQRVAAVVEPTGALFADVAVLAPVLRARLRTPLALAGPGRGPLAAFLEPLGVPLEDAGAGTGAAATRKLLRSVFVKGLAAVIMEALDAAEAAGQVPWVRAQITAELTGADAELVDRLVGGTRQHAVRRLDEMRAAADLLEELGVANPATRATVASLRALVTEPARQEPAAREPAADEPAAQEPAAPEPRR